jgi:hypothetical protein
MLRSRFIAAAVLLLAAHGARAATLVHTDFTLTDRALAPVGWQTNGAAGLAPKPDGPGPVVTLALTHNQTSEAGTAWTLLRARVPSFTMWADISIDFDRAFPDNCPADGLALAFASGNPDAVGGSGSSLGLYGNEDALPRFIALEINTFYGQSLEGTDNCTNGKFLTFAFANSDEQTGVSRPGGSPEAGGGKIAQTTAPDALKVVNGGWYRYQWNVDAAAGTMTAYVTGLEEGNKLVQNQQVAEVKFGSGAPNLNFIGRWGVTAATGGLVMGTHVAQVRVDAPMVAAGAPPTGGD